MRILLSALALGIALTGCTRTMEPAASGERLTYAVRLHNDGTVPLTNVEVRTGENVPPITIASLPPGVTSASATVNALHEHPLAMAVASGRSVSAHPIEGFIRQYNALLAPGSYVIQLRYVTAQQSLEVQVVRE